MSLGKIRRCTATVAALLGVTAASLTAITAAGLATATPASADSLATNVWFSVVNRGSSKCVDARNAASRNGTALQQYSCNNTFAQRYMFAPTSNGYFKVVNGNNGNAAWDVTGQSKGNGAQMELWSYWGGWNQQWKPVPVGRGGQSGYYAFINRNSQKCLDVPAGSFDVGVQLQQWDCQANNDNQEFLLIKPGAQVGRGEVGSYNVNWGDGYLRLNHGVSANLVALYGFETPTVAAVSKAIGGKGDPRLMWLLKKFLGIVGIFPMIQKADVGYGVVIHLTWLPWPSIHVSSQ